MFAENCLATKVSFKLETRKYRSIIDGHHVNIVTVLNFGMLLKYDSV